MTHLSSSHSRNEASYSNASTYCSNDSVIILPCIEIPSPLNTTYLCSSLDNIDNSIDNRSQAH